MRHRSRRMHARRFWAAWLGSFAVFCVLGTLWSFAQPLLSGADEVQHVLKAQAVFTGQWTPPFQSYPAQFMGSAVTAHRPPDEGECYITKAYVPASCLKQPQPKVWPKQRTVTYIGRHPVLPYLFIGGGLALDPGPTGLYLSRFLTAATAAAFIATAIALAVSRRRPFLLLGIVIAATPAAIAGLGVLSSSPFETASATLAFVTIVLLASGERPTGRMLALAAGSLAALSLSRPVSFVWTGLAGLALVVLLTPKGSLALLRQRAVQLGAAGVVVAVGIAFAWYARLRAAPDPNCFANCTGPMWDFLRADHVRLVHSISARLSPVLAEPISYWRQAMSAVGYNEYVGPWYTQLGWTILIGGVTLFGAVLARLRTLLVLAILVFVLFALPVVVQTMYYPDTGVFWQGRYDLPLLAGILVLAASVLDDVRARLPELRRLAYIAVPLAGVLQFLAFWGTLRRYAVGTNGALAPWQWGAGWHAPIPPAPLFVLMLVATAASYAWFMLLIEQSGRSRTAGEVTAPAPVRELQPVD